MEFNKNFGFGCMRLPVVDNHVDKEEFKKMVDLFISSGFNYFDTARVYLGGESETALKECLVNRYPRESFFFVDKLSNIFKSTEEIEPLFFSQLESTGLKYFDLYLMHAQGSSNYPKYQEMHAYEIALKLKEQGYIKHFGISFHDTPEYLDKILTENPQIEFVQIQYNYLDLDNPSVRSRECLEVCKKHNKHVIIMEPVKGGHLANLSNKAREAISKIGNASPATYALRFAASSDNVVMVLSGMSNLDQVLDNVSAMKDFKPLTLEEKNILNEVKDIIVSENLIPCTKCRYCVPGCPKHILIPDVFTLINDFTSYHNWAPFHKYQNLEVKANECIKCGKCENICPQHLEIRSLLEKAHKVLNREDD